ncbi:MAG: amino acid adenylation domain-containing protein [Chitinophagaceae bacterium]|nr:amino acid adenylation domain-containing protein [Chitinophagaceae bacterium]
MSNFVDHIIFKLKKADAQISVDGVSLKIDAEKGAIDDELKSLIVKHKAELIDYINKARKKISVQIPQVKRNSQSYVLSSSQKRIWLLSQFQDANMAYNITGVYIFKGNVDLTALQYAFESVISRHEALRTFFKEDENGDIKQFIIPDHLVKNKIYEEDCRGRKDSWKYISNMIDAESLYSFNLTSGPLLKASLYQVEDHQWVFGYNIHHIVSDGWSMDILIKELLLFYNAHLRDEKNTIGPLNIHYIDYATWQQEQLKGDAVKRAREYWLSQFQGDIPVLQFPEDKERPLLKTFNGASVNWMIDPEISSAIKQFSQELGATLFMYFLAVVYGLLNRYTNQQDIIIGTPIAGREHADLDMQIGCYINTLALRCRFEETDSFLQLMLATKKITLEAYENQIFPFDELVDALSVKRDIARSPLFDVMVSFDNESKENIDQQFTPDTFEVSRYPGTVNVISKFDLSFSFTELDEGIDVGIEYNTDIYLPSTITRMADNFNQLLTSIIANPEKSICSLDLVSPGEKETLLVKYNNTATNYPYDKTIIALFEEQVAKTPDEIAVAYGQNSIIYRDLNARVNRLAGFLREKYQLGCNDLVSILLKPGELMIVAILGVLKSGAAYVPISPDYPKERVDYIHNFSQCKILLDEQELMQAERENELFSQENPVQVNQAGDIAYVIYTSGSTGKPKGVMITHRSLVARITAETALISHASLIRTCLCTSFVFDVSLLEIFIPLINGGCVLIPTPAVELTTADFFIFLKENKITILQGTPGFIQQFLSTVENNDESLDDLQDICIGGESLPNTLFNNLKKRFPKVRVNNHYGPTEATIDSVIYSNIQKFQSNLIGSPLANTTIDIINSHNNIQPIGIAGEICIGGVGLALGYLNEPELTTSKFTSNPYRHGTLFYRTGDIGRWLDDGKIEFLGRMDDQVKVRGYRIDLGEIESVLTHYPKVATAVVLTTGSTPIERELVAYIICNEEINAKELMDNLGRTLPTYMIPSKYIQLQEFPLTNNGKIDRKKIPSLEGKALEIVTYFELPQNKTEEALVRIWSNILGRESNKIGTNNSFFELGGHSLLAARIVSAICAEMNIAFTIKDLFVNLTIRKISLIINERINDKSIANSEENSWFNFKEFSGAIRVNNDNLYDLVHQQKKEFVRYLIVGKFAYNLFFSLKFNKCNTLFLEKAIYLLIERHESLRTTYILSNNEFKQRVHPEISPEFVIEYIDLSNIKEKDAKIEDIRQRVADKKFDMETGPLIDVKIIAYSQELTGLLFAMPHVNSDAISVGILKKEIEALYFSLVKEEEYPLSKISLQYKDYGQWVNEYLTSAKGKEAKDFYQRTILENISKENGGPLQQQDIYSYRNTLKNELVKFLPPYMPEYYDKIYGTLVNIKSQPGASYTIFIKEGVWNRIKKISVDSDVSLFTTLISLLSIIHMKTHNTQYLRIFIPFTTRIFKEFENIVGWLTSEIILCIEIDDTLPLRELIKMISKKLIEVSQYRFYPYEKILNDLDLTLNIVSPVFMNYMNMSEENIEDYTPFKSADGDFIAFHKPKGNGHFNFKYTIEEYKNGTLIGMEYNLNTYSPVQVEAMANDLLSLLEKKNFSANTILSQLL